MYNYANVDEMCIAIHCLFHFLYTLGKSTALLDVVVSLGQHTGSATIANTYHTPPSCAGMWCTSVHSAGNAVHHELFCNSFL